MNTPYNEGKQAFLDGKPVDTNPYRYPTLSYVQWWGGWIELATRLEG